MMKRRRYKSLEELEACEDWGPTGKSLGHIRSFRKADRGFYKNTINLARKVDVRLLRYGGQTPFGPNAVAGLEGISHTSQVAVAFTSRL